MAPFELLLLAAGALSLQTTALPSNRGDTDAAKDILQLDHSQHHRPASTGIRYQSFQEDSEQVLMPIDWLSYDELWRINRPAIISGNGGNTYIEFYIKDAIEKVSKESTVDARLLLLIMMQEVSRSQHYPPL
jgi:hypothetical protein